MRSGAGICLAAAVAACSVLSATSAFAAEPWPTRSVRVIVPHPAGGSVDAVARIVTRKLADALGKPFIVENRGGANGNLGAAAAAGAPADGYTLLFTTTGPLVYNRLIYRAAAVAPPQNLPPPRQGSPLPP